MPKGAIDPRAQPIRNLATDPRGTRNATTTGVNLFGYIGRYPAGSSYTAMTNQTGLPDGITTFIRRTSTAVELKAGRGFDHGFNVELATNPNLHSLVVSAGQYVTVAVWVRVIAVDTNLTGMIRGAFFNSGGARLNIVIPTATTLTSGTWSRLSATFLIPEGAVRFSAITYISSTNASSFAIGDTIDATGLMAVIGKTVPSRHHDGDSYGWKWDGVVNASTSVGYIESPNLIRNHALHPNADFYWSIHSSGSPYGATSGSIEAGFTGAPNAIRGTFTSLPTSGRPSIKADLATNITRSSIIAGKTYTGSIWGLTSWAIPGGKILVQFWDASGTIIGTTLETTGIPMAAGVWTRHSMTFTAPATAQYVTLYFTSGTSAYPTTIGDYFQATGAMITEGTTLYDYSDGNTTGWRWEATAGASVSVGYPDSSLIIRNFHTQPYADSTVSNWGSSAGTGGVATISIGPGFGTIPRSYRQTFSTLPASGRPNITSGNSSNRVPITGGVEYTFSAFGLYSWATSQPRILVQFFNSLDNLIGNTIEGPGPTAVPNQWSRYSVTTTAPAGAVYTIAYISAGYTLPTVIGDYFQATGFMITQGSTLHEYSDGNSVGWQWEASVGMSKSKGYSSTLDAILGGNYLINVTGSADLSVSTPLNWPNAPSLNQSWVGFMVYDYKSYSASTTPGLIYVGDTMDDISPNTFSTIRINSSSSLATSVAIMRRTNGSGPSSLVGELGRHLVTFGINAGHQFIGSDGRPSSPEAATMNYTPLYYRLPSSGYVERVRFILVPGVLDADTINAAEAWFANKYGVILAG